MFVVAVLFRISDLHGRRHIHGDMITSGDFVSAQTAKAELLFTERQALI